MKNKKVYFSILGPAIFLLILPIFYLAIYIDSVDYIEYSNDIMYDRFIQGMVNFESFFQVIISIAFIVSFILHWFNRGDIVKEESNLISFNNLLFISSLVYFFIRIFWLLMNGIDSVLPYIYDASTILILLISFLVYNRNVPIKSFMKNPYIYLTLVIMSIIIYFEIIR